MGKLKGAGRLREGGVPTVQSGTYTDSTWYTSVKLRGEAWARDESLGDTSKQMVFKAV